MDLLTPYSHNAGLQAITALPLICTHHSSPLHTHYGSQSSLVVSWQGFVIVSLSLQITYKSSSHRLILFLAFFLEHLRLLSPELDPFRNCSNNLVSLAALRHEQCRKHSPSIVEYTCLLIHCMAMDVLLLHRYASTGICLPTVA
jgi:hypothetical protein